MPGFRYQAYNVEGKLHKGVLEADSARQARAALRDQGLTPYRVEVIAANDPGGAARASGRLALSSTELTQLTRGLASLLEAGLTVEQAFNALIEQAENERTRQVLAALRGEVIAGNTVAKALASFPDVFPELYRTLVAAGESSGQLPRVLTQARRLPRGAPAAARRLSLALIYPAIVMVVALVVVGALLVYVLPQVVQVFQHAHQQLPILTRALIALLGVPAGDMGRCGSRWPSAVALALRVALRRPASRAAIHRFLWRAPLVGRVLRHLDAARLAATLSILVGSRVPILQALEAGHRRDDAGRRCATRSPPPRAACAKACRSRARWRATAAVPAGDGPPHRERRDERAPRRGARARRAPAAERHRASGSPPSPRSSSPR